MNQTIPSHCFRQYDIRGIADREFSDSGVERLGRAVGTYLRRRAEGDSRQVTVARDARLSSERIGRALVRGLASAGCDVIDLGVCPTPLLYFSLFELSPRGGVMVTGSHNPPEYNGFKVCAGKETLYGDQIQDVRRILAEGDFERGEGAVTSREIIPRYIDFMVEHFSGVRDLARARPGFRVVLDSGNGTAGLVAPEIMRRIGVDRVELFSEPDGTFPHHHPDPTVPENLTPLIAAVEKEGAEAGVAFDGDADRIGVVDSRGTIIWGDCLMALFSGDILKEHPGAAVIGEVKCSQVMYDEIGRCGGSPIMWKTGHSLIKKKMKEEKALLAGEMSGHLFFADRYFGYDDAIYASLRLVELLLRGTRLAEWVGAQPKVCATPEIRVECTEEEKFKIVERLGEILADAGAFRKRFGIELKDVITVDGIRAVCEKGWALVRASNTQPVLVVRYEAGNEEDLGRIRSAFETVLAEARR